MRILLVIPTLELGGSERQAIRLAKFLKDNNHHVEVWGFNSPEGLGAKFCESQGVSYKCIHFYGGLGRFRFPYQLLKYTRIFRKFKPDVIYSYCDGPNVLCGLIWKFTGAKLFIWGQRSSEILYTNKFLLNKSLSNVKVIVSNSTKGLELIKSTKNNNRNTSFVKINNGVHLDQEKFTLNEWRVKLGIEPKNKVGLMISNLMESQGKDHYTLLRAWKKVLNTEPNAILLLAGRLAESTDKIIELALELNIISQIRLLGKIVDINGLINVSDIIIHSSNVEGVPNAVLEAMYGGKPLVGTAISGIMEALPQENHKYLSEPDDFNQMSKNILTIIGDPNLSQNISKLNKDYVDIEFSFEKMCKETLSLINKNLSL